MPDNWLFSAALLQALGTTNLEVIQDTYLDTYIPWVLMYISIEVVLKLGVAPPLPGLPITLIAPDSNNVDVTLVKPSYTHT